ncbi:MAG: hypothetical protein ACI4HO_02435 [Ruminococcus sp.]
MKKCIIPNCFKSECVSLKDKSFFLDILIFIEVTATPIIPIQNKVPDKYTDK